MLANGLQTLDYKYAVYKTGSYLLEEFQCTEINPITIEKLLVGIFAPAFVQR